MKNKEFKVTNDILYAAIEASIDRVKNQIIDELILSDDEKLLDEILDDVQECLVRAEMQKKIYHSWIFEGTIPDEFIYDPGGPDTVENDEDIEDDDE